MDRARQAADDGNAAALETATREVYSRLNAIFYLSTVRYIGQVLDDAQAGDHDSLGTHQVEALSFYRSIQPEVAKADPTADETIVAYLQAEPDQVTVQLRDQALAALNGAASGLLLAQADLVSRYDDDTGDGPSGVASPHTGGLDLTSSLFITAGQYPETDGPTKSDGYYTPTTNREIYQKISTYYQEIAKLTDVIKEGKPLPAADILLLYEAWAIYVGEEVDGEYPNSLAATARSREANFGREGTIDIPLRQAMDRARQAADDGDAAALEKATQEVYSRFNAIFYLGAVRYKGRVLDDAGAGDHDSLATHQVEALAFYQSIQPAVAKADPSANDTIIAFLEAEPDGITTASRDAALAALNTAASALLLEQSDLVTSFE